MAEIVNLGKVRKSHARRDREAEANANRAKFGQTKAERGLKQREAERLRKTLDGAKRQNPTEE